MQCTCKYTHACTLVILAWSECAWICTPSVDQQSSKQRARRLATVLPFENSNKNLKQTFKRHRHACTDSGRKHFPSEMDSILRDKGPSLRVHIYDSHTGMHIQLPARMHVCIHTYHTQMVSVHVMPRHVRKVCTHPPTHWLAYTTQRHTHTFTIRRRATALRVYHGVR